MLMVHGSAMGATGWSALGLLAVTLACRVSLRRSERGRRTPARAAGRGPHPQD
ncbi:hypothetical protein ACN20G_17275 [Streptomyces sp. BI20]|uniref:hypothetical protein n=1 Tax=Streptomyces sp. BI20 TaxID=3403460 RepID=UPI003C71E778